MEWQPIETAPKDGTEVLVAGGEYGCEETGHEFQAKFDEVAVAIWWEKGWRGGDSLNDYYYPTHWMPLPDPPKVDK